MLDRYIWGDAERISQEALDPFCCAQRSAQEHLGGEPVPSPRCCVLSGRRLACWASSAPIPMPPRVRRTFSSDLDVDQEGVVVDPTRPDDGQERHTSARPSIDILSRCCGVDFENREPVTGRIELRTRLRIAAKKLRGNRHRSDQRLRQGERVAHRSSWPPRSLVRAHVA